MQGKRHDLTPEYEALEPGEYGKHYENGMWYCRAPQFGGFYAGMGNLSAHEIIEHEDGTITVSPSILITGHHDKQWHGYLEGGIWREV
jgi:hypothetical protein